MSKTTTQIENLQVAYSVMFGIPAKKIDLSSVRVKVDKEGNDDSYAISDKKMLFKCNTHGCVAGYLSAHPHFKAQGLKYKVSEEEIVFGTGEARTYELESMSKQLFGDMHIFDAGDEDLRGKKQALRRIRKALREAKAISSERNDELHAIEEQLES